MPKKPFHLKTRKRGIRARQQLKMYGTTVTKQSFKDDCDINKIMAKFIHTGIIDHVREHGPEYGFASSDTFRDSMEIVSKGQTMFEELPSSVRNKFNNEPGQFLDFVQNPDNLEEMQEMGLANKTPQLDPSLAQPSLTSKASAKPEAPSPSSAPLATDKDGGNAPASPKND